MRLCTVSTFVEAAKDVEEGDTEDYNTDKAANACDDKYPSFWTIVALVCHISFYLLRLQAFPILLLDHDQLFCAAFIVIGPLGHCNSDFYIAVITDTCESAKAGVVLLQIVTRYIRPQSKAPIEFIVQVAGDLLITALLNVLHLVIQLKVRQIFNTIDGMSHKFIRSLMSS